MLRHVLRPFLPQTWRAQPSANYSVKGIEERVTVILAEIEADYDFWSFSLDSFAQWVQTKRNRPIQFVPLRFPSTVSGGWLQLARKDWVFFEADALPLFQAHIQLHEISHMLCGHKAIDLGDATDLETLGQLIAYLTELFEDPDRLDELMGPVLFRSHRSVLEEIEAECLSTLILERVSVRHFEKVLTQPVCFSKMAVDVYEAMRMA